jgi:sarcosine/dimethylglycine N-methyltransferase
LAADIRSAIDFYERHPISAAIVLAKLEASRGHLNGLKPEELFPHDQDHYGGLAANDAIAERARIGRGTRVADFCAGLGGPARYLAHTYGAEVTGIELTPARVAGANDLTHRVGLDAHVHIVEGNVMAVPLSDGSMDAVISQEAFLHVPNLGRALAEAFRILRTGGRLAYTNWVAARPLSDADTELMWQGMAVASLYNIGEQQGLLERAGFRIMSVEDLTGEWGPILEQRFAMYRKLRREAEAAGTPAGHDAFYLSYERLVQLVKLAALGGGRFTAEKPG